MFENATPRGYLQPAQTVAILQPGAVIPFSSTAAGSLITGGYATLTNGSYGVVNLGFTLDASTATVTVPDTIPPGRYRFLVVGTAALVTGCPAASCSAALTEQFSHLVEVEG